MSWLTNVDHISYAVAKGMIEKWAWFHIEVEGGKLINRIDDVRPGDPDSSMKIWCIDYGNFGVALIEGIDRAKKSQVTAFVDKHGDHSIQHVAYDTKDLEAFQNHLGKFNARPRGETLVRNDGFGILKQMFAKGYNDSGAAESPFPEYVERPRASGDQDDINITFSQQAGKGFYDQIEEAREKNDTEPLIDFTNMPSNWKVPDVQAPAQ